MSPRAIETSGLSAYFCGWSSQSSSIGSAKSKTS